MGRKYTPKEKLYNETTIMAAVEEVVNQGKQFIKQHTNIICLFPC